MRIAADAYNVIFDVASVFESSAKSGMRSAFVLAGAAVVAREEDVHGVTAALLIALIVIHVLAAFKHLLFDRDKVFQRMLPGRRE